MHLPVLSGLEVYLELKKMGKAYPTIIITGYADEAAASIDKLRFLSVTGCLTRPFALQKLLGAIQAGNSR